MSLERREQGELHVEHSVSVHEARGHSAGAFTGADEDQPGLLEKLDGGTLLLDDIGTLPLEVQPKLLRFIEEGVIRPLGSLSRRRIDVRLIASTQADLARAVASGALRADLYYRLRGVQVDVPALRERRDDIPLLARHVLEAHAARLERAVPTLERDALDFLSRQDWPGNVRELETVLLGALIQQSHAEPIRRQDLEPCLRPPPEPKRTGLLGRDLAEWKRDLEREYLLELFRETRGNARSMMARLGVKRTRLYAWLRDLGIDPTAERRELQDGSEESRPR